MRGGALGWVGAAWDQLLAAFGETAAWIDCTGAGFGRVCFLVLVVVKGRGLAALQLEVSAFGLEIMALRSFI